MAESKDFKILVATSKKAEELTELLNEAGVTQEIIDSGKIIRGEIKSTEKGTGVEITGKI